MRTIPGLAAALTVAAALLAPAPATASHPTQICLDVEPEDYFATSNDDIVDGLRAMVGATDAGHPPEQEGCVIGEGSGSGTTVDFEIDGVADPDDGFSPESPDMTCTIAENDDLCWVYPPSSGGGTQTIHAWIDFDSETTEVDADEGPDEDQDPGAAEPDATDVVLWTWTHRDPPPPTECNDGADNDDDGLVDLEDPDCTASNDTSESPAGPIYPLCSNGIDDDGDAEIDGGDSGCRHVNDNSEAPEKICWDGYDDPKVCTSIAFRYLKRRDAFRGRINSTRERCENRTDIEVRRHRDDSLFGRKKTDRLGRWRIDASRRTKGRFYIVALPKTFTDRYGLAITCPRTRTHRFRVP